MAIVSSPLFDNISGKCGGVVFCKLKNGKIVMKALPLNKKHRKYSPSQQAHMDLWKEVCKRQRFVKRDPVELAKYVARCPTDQYIDNFMTSELWKELIATKTQG
jgi:hypothetical protein